MQQSRLGYKMEDAALRQLLINLMLNDFHSAHCHVQFKMESAIEDCIQHLELVRKKEQSVIVIINLIETLFSALLDLYVFKLQSSIVKLQSAIKISELSEECCFIREKLQFICKIFETALGPFLGISHSDGINKVSKNQRLA